jgi:hypothetical protein
MLKHYNPENMTAKAYGETWEYKRFSKEILDAIPLEIRRLALKGFMQSLQVYTILLDPADYESYKDYQAARIKKRREREQQLNEE